MTQLFGVLGNLHGQFAGGRQRQNTGLGGKTLFLVDRSFQQRLNRGNQKGCSLAGARLSLANEVFTGQGPGQCFCLNGRAVLEANFGNGIQQSLVQIEVAEA